MTNLIQEVRAALQAATPGPWKDNGNEVVSERNERVGIGGFLTEEDNNLAANSPAWLKQLIERVEEQEWEMSVSADQQQYEVNMLNSRIETAEKKNEAAKSMLESYGRITNDMEDDYKILQNKYSEVQHTVLQLTDRLEEAVKALEWYADPKNYTDGYERKFNDGTVIERMSFIQGDEGLQARATLKRIKGDL